MKKYRIKTEGLDNEVGTILLGYQGKNLMRLDIAPKQLFVLELIEDTDTLNEVKSVFPDAIDVTNLPM